VVIGNPGQFLLALELYTVNEAAKAGPFDQRMLQAVLESMPLDPGTSEPVEKALTLTQGARGDLPEASRRF
jgi:hypothetical protein